MARTPPSDDTELLVTVARMYYEHSASQQQIAGRLGVSRPTVSRLLERARETGIVRIEIIPPDVDPGLAERLRERLQLNAVHVAPGRADEADPGPVLASSVERALDEARPTTGDVMLVSWGRAVHSVSRRLHRAYPGVLIAPAMGGNAGDQPWFQPNDTVRILAQAVEGQARYFHAPALLSPALYDTLLAEGQLDAILAMWERAKVSLVGVGAWPKPDPSYAAAGFPVDDPALERAAGDFAGWSFTIDGTLVPYRDGRRLLGVTPDQLAAIPHSICLAGAVSKAKPAIGAARARLYNVLVTDAPTARAIEEHLDAEESRP
ncbi:MAG: helix-turn-helix domain-containing protein [Actinomycetales bacterium]|nr:helix-turn-helix domain-containing protein [Actinomycetales bacterium]